MSFEGGDGPGALHRMTVDINYKYTRSWKLGEQVSHLPSNLSLESADFDKVAVASYKKKNQKPC